MMVSLDQKRAEIPESIESPALRNRPGSLARREQLSYTEFFEEYVDQGLPVIVPSALRHCPALSRWNLDYLRARAGNPPVRLKAWYGIALGICTALPAKRVLPFYQSYLNYVS